VMASHSVYDKIPDERWNAVIHSFVTAMPSGGLTKACSSAAEHMGAILSEHFPGNGEPHVFSNQVIEKER
jgi:uncharacterized membrane protein